jgi:hypothetical protein
VDASVPATQLAAAMFCLVRGIFLANAQALRGHGWMPLPEAETILRLLLPRDGAIALGSAKETSQGEASTKPSRAVAPSETATRTRAPRAQTKTTSRARVRAGGVG